MRSAVKWWGIWDVINAVMFQSGIFLFFMVLSLKTEEIIYKYRFFVLKILLELHKK